MGVEAHGDDLGDGEAKGDFAALGDVADAAGDLFGVELMDVDFCVGVGLVLEVYLAGGGDELAEHEAEEGGFTGGVGADDGGELVGFKGGGEVFDDG